MLSLSLVSLFSYWHTPESYHHYHYHYISASIIILSHTWVRTDCYEIITYHDHHIIVIVITPCHQPQQRSRYLSRGIQTCFRSHSGSQTRSHFPKIIIWELFLRMISELCEMVKIYQVMIMWSLSGSHNDSFYNTRMMIPNLQYLHRKEVYSSTVHH